MTDLQLQESVRPKIGINVHSRYFGRPNIRTRGAWNKRRSKFVLITRVKLTDGKIPKRLETIGIGHVERGTGKGSERTGPWERRSLGPKVTTGVYRNRNHYTENRTHN